MTQPQLFSTAVDRPLTPRQQAALDAIGREPAGLAATALGAVVHTVPGPRSTFTHSAETTCAWCQKAGRQTGDQLVTLGHARRRRGSAGQGLLYVAAGTPAVADDQASVPSGAMLRDDQPIPF